MPRDNPSPKACGHNIDGDAQRTAASGWFGSGCSMGKAARKLCRTRDGGRAPQCPGAATKLANGPPFVISNIGYDAAVLVAADRNERRAWAEHKARLEFGILPLVPAPVVAQASRSPQQAQLRRFLSGCVLLPLGESEAHEGGWLLGKTRTTDIVDAVVVTMAVRKKP